MNSDLNEVKLSLPFISQMYKPMGFDCEIDESGMIITSTKLNDYTKNHVDSVHAVYQFSLAEATGGAVAFAYISFGEYVPVVKSVSIEYLSQARSDLTGHAKLEEHEIQQMLKNLKEEGKHEYKVDIVLKNSEGEVVSKVVGEYVVYKRR